MAHKDDLFKPAQPGEDDHIMQRLQKCGRWDPLTLADIAFQLHCIENDVPWPMDGELSDYKLWNDYSFLTCQGFDGGVRTVAKMLGLDGDTLVDYITEEIDEDFQDQPSEPMSIDQLRVVLEKFAAR